MTPDATRWAWAALASAAWFSLWLAPLRQQWHARRRRSRTGAAAAAAPLLIGYASQSGQAAQLAETLAETLAGQGCPAQARALQTIGRHALESAERMLFIASTTGEGDAPDNAGTFVTRVMREPVRLPRLRYGLLALGDSSYASFCGFGRGLDAWLRASGARPAFERFEADGEDAGALNGWAQAVARFIGVAAQAVVAEAPLASADLSRPLRCTLAQRSVLNPGSPGAPIRHLVLAPCEAMPDWQAGDVARIHLPAPTGRADAWREYTLAALPQDGRIELLVREATRPDGQRGLGSGWLGHALAPGGEVLLQLRRNRGFHAPPVDVPLVLIGNGTGLAGLAVHLKAREHARHAGRRVAPAWLLFGERTQAFDALWDEQLQAWLADGLLLHLNRAFSRDANAPAHYVQDLVRLHAERLRRWAAEGAALYVCGQRDGMAQGVQLALHDIMGIERLEQLTAAGRYRRDVY